MVTVQVILYKASEQEHRHWALYFEGPAKKQHTVYQANGSAHEFTFDKTELEKSPDKSKRFYLAVHVTDALDDPIAAEGALEHVEIDNECPHWNCQDWVLAALESLKDAELIPEYDYHEAEATLMALCGPNDDSD
jgi:Family of unknown function (DUF6540)